MNISTYGTLVNLVSEKHNFSSWLRGELAILSDRCNEMFFHSYVPTKGTEKFMDNRQWTMDFIDTI